MTYIYYIAQSDIFQLNLHLSIPVIPCVHGMVCVLAVLHDNAHTGNQRATS